MTITNVLKKLRGQADPRENFNDEAVLIQELFKQLSGQTSTALQNCINNALADGDSEGASFLQGLDKQTKSVTPERVFVVGPGAAYTTIQSAIDAADAFLEGAGSADNSAIVLVYPKGTPYEEDLTMKNGVSLLSAGANYGRFREMVSIDGQITYSPPDNNNFNNSWIMEGFRLKNYTADESVFKMEDGSSGSRARVYFNHCSFDQANSTAGTIVHSTSGGSNSRLFLRECELFTSGSGLSGSKQILVTGNGRVFLQECLMDCEGGANANHVVEITGGGDVRIYNPHEIFCDGQPEAFLLNPGTMRIYNGDVNYFGGNPTGVFQINSPSTLRITNTRVVTSGSYKAFSGDGNAELFNVSFTRDEPVVDENLNVSVGCTSFSRKNNFSGLSFGGGAPTVNDDDSAGYAVGSFWVDEGAGDAYICVDATGGGAVWKKITP